ncbi:tumor protein D54 isoform X2 [Ischnura elegans]|uniref:tumor protein D54 isoform X2 n=1 Tax=Ischnura elegans TaxID=197161 RepID=UPI001ED88406|nr:tumor protein D54 isoform X2 [Ischnura elegans]
MALRDGHFGKNKSGLTLLDADGEEYMEDCVTEWQDDGEVLVVQGADCDPWSDEYALRLHRAHPTESENQSSSSVPSRTLSACSLEEEFESRGCLRVSFQDLSKPGSNDATGSRIRRMLGLRNPALEDPPNDMSPDSGISDGHHATPEEQAAQREEWSKELALIEDEIQTLRHVLDSKRMAAQELKRKLGLTGWREFAEDMNQGIKNVKESNVCVKVGETVNHVAVAVVSAPIYQKTESAIKATAEKTTSILGGIGSNISCKLGQLKNSESFRSFEERVGSAYENVKTKMGNSRSNSTQSFEEALRETDTRRSGSIGALSPLSATTPTIAEEDASIVKGPPS